MRLQLLLNLNNKIQDMMFRKGLTFVTRFSYANISLSFNAQKHAAYVSLTNVKKRNPLSLQTINELNSAFKEVSDKVESHKLKILILKGQGPVFSAGHDLKELNSTTNPKSIFQQCTKTLFALKKLPIVTLCAVNGVAAAAGFQMALTCDLIIATENSSFSTPGVKWGLFCSTPGVQLVRSINSEKKAKEMLLFGEPINAQQAFRYGLINKVVSQNELQNTINSYIQKVNNLSGEVIALGKQVLIEHQKENLEQAYCIAVDGMHKNIKQLTDCKEGLNAFSQKRHPHYTK